MPLVTSREMLLDARKNGYAVGAFNAENMEMVQAIVAAAEALRAPVMIQTTPSTVRYASVELYAANVRAAAEAASVPVCLHLDHGSSPELARAAMEAGYTSLMIDGSQKPLEENIAVTKQVVDFAARAGIPVEAELGKVGGKEDDLEAENAYTDPEDARLFVERTGVGSLAVAIGTAHGVYKGEPKLDVERLKAIRKVVDIPLVLHGASGLSDEAVRECIREGVCKVNFATELRIAFTDAVRSCLTADPGIIDPKVPGKAARAAVQQLVENRMRVCGCDGRA